MTDRELMQQALEALMAGPYQHNTMFLKMDAITALRERLAQPEQEPVAWLYRDSWGTMKLSQIMPPPVGAFPVYTAPPQPDTKVNSEAIPKQISAPVAHSVVAGALFDFMGWLTSRRERLVLSSTDNASPAADAIKDFAQMRSLSINDAQVQDWQEHLTTPPRREWVGLDRKEMLSIIDQQQAYKETGLPMFYRDQCLDMLRAIEAKLKEKNGRVDSFLRRLLDPEDLGHAVSHEVRQKVRELL